MRRVPGLSDGLFADAAKWVLGGASVFATGAFLATEGRFHDRFSAACNTVLAEQDCYAINNTVFKARYAVSDTLDSIIDLTFD